MNVRTSEIDPGQLRVEDDETSIPIDPIAPDLPAASEGPVAPARRRRRDAERPSRLVTAPAGARPPLTPGRIALMVVGWASMLLIATLAVIYPLGPLSQHRAQHRLLGRFRTDIYAAANDKQGLAGLLQRDAPVAPSVGTPIGIIDVGPIALRQVVVEGVDSGQTWRAPGHVPGTAGLGQPGNAAVVGRRSGWGGPFGSIDTIRRGTPIVVTTIQGQSLYRVVAVRRGESAEQALAPTRGNRLTLLTSASSVPWANRTAVVVVAELDGRPFEPTPQRGRDASSNGTGGDHRALAQLGLFLVLFSWVAWQTSTAHRRWKPVTAYLITTPALVVLAILVAESLSRLLPAWS